MTNCYKILGVKDFSSAEEIKTAYRKLSKKFHPDVNDGDKFFEERFKEIQNAYEILCDTYRKEQHDSKLKTTFSSSSDFEERSKNDREKENTQAKKEDKQPKQETYQANTKTTSKQERKKQTDKLFPINSWGIFIILTILGIIVFALAREKKKSNNTNYAQSSSKTSDYYSNQSVNAPSYQQNESNSYTTQNSIDDDEISQTYSLNADYFTIGSTNNEVLQIQGTPTSISKYSGMNQEVWSYNFSRVTFKNDRVSEYSDLSNNLKIQLTPSSTSKSDADYFTVGSTKDEVLQIQGTPTSVSKYSGMNQEVWSYNFSRITFKNGRVSEYSDLSNNLKIQLTPSTTSKSNGTYFTIGSTKDEVLQVQGNPTSISKYDGMNQEVWSYEFSRITFIDGRVTEYSDLSQNLRIRL